jgi:hypothetical protein
LQNAGVRVNRREKIMSTPFALSQRCKTLGIEVDVANCDWGFVELMLDEVDRLPKYEVEAAVKAINDGSDVKDRYAYLDHAAVLPVGTRVRLNHDVDRYPHFIAMEGALGTVSQVDERLVCVKMDDNIAGAEEWDNEVHWSTDAGSYPLDDVTIEEEGQ